jgi:hypothetical protein
MKSIEILIALGFTVGQILLLIVIGFFGKKLFEYFFSKSIELKKSELNQELEIHKFNLKSESDKHKLIIDKDMEIFKGNLSKMAFEHQTKYQQLHADRVETIKKLFVLLNDLETKMESLMRPLQHFGEKPYEEKYKESSESANTFVTFYETNEILFSTTTCELFEKINSNFLTAWKDFTFSKQYSSRISPEKFKETIDKELNAYSKTLKMEIPKLKNELKDEFRELLGVEKN